MASTRTASRASVGLVCSPYPSSCCSCEVVSWSRTCGGWVGGGGEGGRVVFSHRAPPFPPALDFQPPFRSTPHATTVCALSPFIKREQGAGPSFASRHSNTNLPSETYHCVGLHAVDKDGHRAQPSLLQAFDQLSDVRLLCDHVLAVQQHTHCSTGVRHRAGQGGASGWMGGCGCMSWQQRMSAGWQKTFLSRLPRAPCSRHTATPTVAPGACGLPSSLITTLQHAPVGAAGSRTGPCRSYHRMYSAGVAK